jgi:two-component system sensor histidine kinase UhpB
MKFLRWTDWSLGARLVWITVAPVAVLFCMIASFTYYARMTEVRAEVIERGKVISTAVAESSEYSLVTGNFSELERISRGLMKSDRSIRLIIVRDAKEQEVFRMVAQIPADPTVPIARSTILKQTISVEDFGESGAPHVTGLLNSPESRLKPTVIGRAEVCMSAVNVLAIQKQRLHVQLAIALLGLLASIAVAVLLSNTLKRPLAAVIAALNSVRAGKYDVVLPISSGGEIGNLQASVNEMSISLRESKQDLERKVQERTIALELSRNEAVKANFDKRKLIQKVNTAVEDERKSISVEIHDQLNATLIAAKLNSERILHLAELDASTPGNTEIAARAQVIMKLTLELYESARIIVRRLRPEVLDMLGLKGAIEEMILTFNASHPSCHFQFKENGDCSKLEGNLSITLFRLIQEGLSNVVKHAEATQAYVTLKIDEPGRSVRLVVLDNGIGCSVSAEGEGIGLIGMKERVFPYNGSFQFESQPGLGTKITICLPLVSEPSDQSDGNGASGA